MIKPIEEDALNMSSKLYVKCPKCGIEETYTKIPPINVGSQEELDELKDFTCSECNTLVWEDEKTRQAKETIYKPTTRVPCLDCKRNGFNSTQNRAGNMFVCERVPDHKSEVRPEDN